jgi:demethylmenaquinone methyltransferase/2-methoxy-6-polyprenyl-1,4-benzoquinol methylase
MGWYDVFSGFYDRSLEALYADARVAAAKALQLRPGHTVLDLPCGTGLSLDVLAPEVGERGCVIGGDLSAGMLGKANGRIEANGWTNVHTVQLDAYAVTRASLADYIGDDGPDRVLVFLGLTAMARYEEAFAALWELLADGGRMVIVDVHAERLGLQGRMVNLVARADIRRRVWEPLEAVAQGFVREPLPPKRQYGGTLYVAAGDKPRS